MKRAWRVSAAIVIGVALLSGVTLMALLRQPKPYPFVDGATIERSQEYIEDFPGHSRLSREAVYRVDDTFLRFATLVGQTLKPPEWKRTPSRLPQIYFGSPFPVKFENATTHVTLESRLSGGTTIFIQEFKDATLSDRVRLWWKKHFKS